MRPSSTVRNRPALCKMTTKRATVSIFVYRADLRRFPMEAGFSVLNNIKKRRASQIANQCGMQEFVKTGGSCAVAVHPHSGRPTAGHQIATNVCGNPP